MLILTRAQGETIVIDGGIEVTVLKIQGRQVRIGVNAPKHVKVMREELVERDRARDQQSRDL